jgi:hypothetical protein
MLAILCYIPVKAIAESIIVGKKAMALFDVQ